MTRRRRTSRLLLLAAAAGGLYVARSQALGWGTTPQEANATLPGDDLLPEADFVATRATTIRTDPGDIWPWIVQMGQDRGGFYSWDAAENLIGLDIHSADAIEAAWQGLAVGDTVALAKGVNLSVVALEPDHALVLRGSAPVGSETPMPFDFTWSFVLRPQAYGAGPVTRMIVRERYEYLEPWARPLVEVVQWVSLVMTLKMLSGIRARAEGTHVPAVAAPIQDAVLPADDVAPVAEVSPARDAAPAEDAAPAPDVDTPAPDGPADTPPSA